MFYKITDDKEDVEILKTLHETIPNTKDGKSSVEMDSKIVAYNIITTSDKVINGRIYPDAYVKITALSDRWVQRFAKPFLVNHDIYTEALGRICDAVHYQHSDGVQSGGKEVIPESVIDYFKKKKCFDEGTGSVIGKIMITKDTVDKIKSAVYFTTSQSSATDGYVCNICGSNYFECSHISGRSYEKDGTEETCIPRTKELYPIENSSVNSPANDTSILILFDVEKQKIILNSVDEILYQQNNKEENSDNKIIKNSDEFDKNKIIEDNATIENKKQEVTTMGVQMTEDQIKAGLARIKASDTSAFEKAVTGFCGEEGSKDMKQKYATISDDSLSIVNAIVDSIITTASGKIKELEDKLKESEEKIKTLEAASADSKETEEGDSGETKDEGEGTVNKKTVPKIEPTDKKEEEEKEEEPATDEDDIYARFKITSKKGGKK